MRRLVMLGCLMAAASGALAQQPESPRPEAPQAQPAPPSPPPSQSQPAPAPPPQGTQPIRPLVEREYKVEPGKAVRIGAFATIKADCTTDTLPTVKLGEQPKHGQVIVRQQKIPVTNYRQCLAMEVPAFVAFYRAKPDFPGKDVLTLEVRDKAGRLQVQRITITTGTSTGKPADNSI